MRIISNFSGTLLGLCLSVLPLQAATYTATNISYGAVSAAIAASADGDTVNIPAGNTLWSSTLILTKAITLAGAGTNSTIINGNGKPLVSVALSADKPLRITAISFNSASGSTQPTIVLNSKMTAFRVDHCKFNFGKRAVNPDGWTYGVVDHCAFINCDIGVGITGDDNWAWGRPVEPGSTNCVCIEDNAFIINNSVPQEPNEPVYHQEGTRTIIRHNLFDASSYSTGNPNFIDAHGNNNYFRNNNNTDFRGTVLMECYSNIFHVIQTYQFSYFRGGTLFVYGNTMLSDLGTPAPFVLTEEEGWQTLTFNPLRTSWPAQDQITNSYFWGNTLNGSPVLDVDRSNPNDSIFIQQGRDYWMHSPNTTNVYYPYTPLAYPHPIVTAQDHATAANALISVASAAPTSGPAPLSVTFSSAGSFNSKGVALSYLWNFGDGAISTAANPSHTYLTTNSYVSRLTISDGLNTVISGNVIIDVHTPGSLPLIPVAKATPTNGVPPLAVAFSSAGSFSPAGVPLTYNWTFGDGLTAQGANPSHTYRKAGVYTVRLTISDGTNSAAASPFSVIADSAP